MFRRKKIFQNYEACLFLLTSLHYHHHHHHCCKSHDGQSGACSGDGVNSATAQKGSLRTEPCTLYILTWCTKSFKRIPPYSVLHIISRKCWNRWLLENLIMRIQQNIKRCKEQILYFCKEGPSYENNIANPSQQRIWLVMQQRHAAKHSDNTSLVTGDPSFMLVYHNIPHYHCSRCLVSPFKKGRDLWNNE